MKRKFSTLIFLFWLSSIISLFAQYVEPINTLTVPYLKNPIIDGDADDGYSNWVPMKIVIEAFMGIPPKDGDAIDFNAQFKIAWDTSYLYLLVDITDDIEESMPVGGANQWTWDNFEVFIDLDTNSTTNTYSSSSTAQLRFCRGEGAIAGGGGFGRAMADDYIFEQIIEADGWIVELAIPWTAASATGEYPDMHEQAKDIIGFDISVADADGDGTGTEGGRNLAGGAMMFWDLDAPLGTGNEDNAYQNRRVFGHIKLDIPPDLVKATNNYSLPVRILNAPGTSKNIIIDGLTDDSYGTWQDLKIVKRAGMPVVNYEQGDDIDFNAHFKVCYDYSYLYILCDITDDVEESVPYGGTNLWTWDNAEIYIDIDTNSIIKEYDNNSTLQVRVNRGDYGGLSFHNRNINDDQAKYFEINRVDGWTFEVAVPWEIAMDTSLTSDELKTILQKKLKDVIGFDLQVVDADGDGSGAEGGRNINGGAQMFWDLDTPIGNEDNAWNDRSVFGHMKLTPVPETVIFHHHYIQPVNKMEIQRTVSPVIIDGASDISYGDFQTMKVVKEAGSGVMPHDGDEIDFNAKFKTCWDLSYLYVYCEITDDVEESLPLGGANEWTWDNCEIFIDLDTNSNTNTYYSNSTTQIRINRGESGITNPGRALSSDFIYKEINESNGWIFEVAIPWKTAAAVGTSEEEIALKLNDLKINNVIGFEISVSDADGDGSGSEGGRNIYGGSQMFWDLDEPLGTGNEDNAYQNRRTFGFARLTDVNLPNSVGYYEPVNTAIIPGITNAIVIDGEAEASYGEFQKMKIYKESGTVLNNYKDGDTDDFDAQFKLCWDWAYLYLYCEVTDNIEESIPEGGSNKNTWDALEIFLDLDTSSIKPIYSDLSTSHILYNRGQFGGISINKGRGSVSDFLYNEKNNPDGWKIELAIPWKVAAKNNASATEIKSKLQKLQLNGVIGFDLTVSDADGNGTGSQGGSNSSGGAQMFWDLDEPIGREDYASTDRRSFGHLKPGEYSENPNSQSSPVRVLFAPYTTESINLDGIADFTYGQIQDLKVSRRDGIPLSQYVEGDYFDFNAHFRVCYDYNYFYLLCNVIDDIESSIPQNGPNSWTWDNCEIYIDIDTNNNISTYSSSTNQIRINRGNFGGVSLISNDSIKGFPHYMNNESNGWSFEIAIPWKKMVGYEISETELKDLLNKNIESGAMGFDFSAHDGDNLFNDTDGGSFSTGGANMFWDTDNPVGSEYLVFENRRLFGLVKLIEKEGQLGITPDEQSTYRAYPNPSSGKITFYGLKDVPSIDIYNLFGMKIKTITVSSDQMEISNLPKGIYLAKLNNHILKFIIE